VPVLPGRNLLGNVYPVPLTLAASRLYTGDAATGVRAGTAANADKVLLYNGESYDTFYYQARTARNAAGWRKVGDPTTSAANVEIPAGGAIVLQRGGRMGFNWSVPAPIQ
jgi:hypothetical protein